MLPKKREKFGETIKKFGLDFRPVKQTTKQEDIALSYQKIELPEDIMGERDIISREYRIFKKEEALSRKLRTFYEKFCNFSEKIIKVQPDKNTKEKMERAIEVAHLNITPRGAAAASVVSCVMICLLAVILLITNTFFGIGLSLGNALVLFAMSIPVAYYLYGYPMRLEKIYRIRIGSEISFLILYMVVYMRESPNLEGALEFAARNLSGPLALDMRKIMWDVEIGKYRSMDEALINYVMLWVGERYFVEAIQLLRASTQQVEERRLMMLDESIELVLAGTREKAKYYSQDLKMPILLMHAIGILLPVMGLVMFPIIGIFLDISSEILFIGYDIVLPLVLFFFINSILENRPITFTGFSASEHPELPPPGKFSIKTRRGSYLIPVIPFSLLISSPIIIFGAWLYSSAPPTDNLVQSAYITFGIIVAVFLYYFLSSFQRSAVRTQTIKVEEEFTEALFQLGNHVSSGAPLEIALERATRAISGLTIKNFFQLILKNIRDLGMTLSDAIFDRENGAINFYPSKLIRSIMSIVVDSSKKGVQVAAITMLNISRYMKNLHDNQEKIHDMLEDVLSSLRFQGFLLTPLVSGMIVTMATVIINIMGKLGAALESIKSNAYMVPMMPWSKINITPGEFQLICSIYFIETSILIGIFINGIENGEDEVGKQELIAWLILIGFLIYVVSLFASLAVFGPITNINF